MGPGNPDAAGTILLVDDDENCRRMIQRAMRSRGWIVYGASNAREAMSIYATVHPDVVVTDLMMPGGDGNSLIAKAQKLDPNVCILTVTGLSPGDARVVHARQGGAHNVLHKPFSGADIAAAIATTLGQD